MASVETVRGPVELDDLGRTLMHEHIFIMQPEALQNWGHAFGPATGTSRGGSPMRSRSSRACARPGSARSSIRPLRARPLRPADPRGRRGGRPEHHRRDRRVRVPRAAELPRATGASRRSRTLFVREIREGINDTGIKAAFLKCAVERHGLVGDVPRIIEAIAMAATETGAPVMVHTNAEQRTGLLALDALTRTASTPAGS